MIFPEPTSDDDALAAASEALMQHDDRTAMRFLTKALRSPNKLLQTQAFARLEGMLYRLRGAQGFRDFLDAAGKGKVVPEIQVRVAIAVAETQTLIDDQLEGRHVGDRALHVLEGLRTGLLELFGLHDDLRVIWAPILHSYSQALWLAYCTCDKNHLLRFCNEHFLHAWPENSGTKCLMPVKHVKSIIDSEECEDLDEVADYLITTARGLRVSLEFSPLDQDAELFVKFLTEQLETTWLGRLSANLAFLSASHQTLRLFSPFDTDGSWKVEGAIACVERVLRNHSDLSTADLLQVAHHAPVSGSMAFLHEYIRGRFLFERGDFAQARRLFDALLQQHALSNVVRNKILHARIASDVGHIRACKTFDLPSDVLVEEAYDLLRELLAAEEPDLSAATAQLHLDFVAVAELPLNEENRRTTILRSRIRLTNEVLKRQDPQAIISADYVATLIQSGSLLGMTSREISADLATAPSLEALADMDKIIRGEQVSEPRLPRPSPETNEPTENLVGESARDDAKWLSEVLTIPSPEKVIRVIASELGGRVESPLEQSPGPPELLRIGIERIACHLGKLLLLEEESEAIRRLLEYVHRLVPEPCLPAETELLLHLEATYLSSTKTREGSVARYEELLSRIIDFVGDRSVGELNISTRTLLGVVNRELSLLRAVSPGRMEHGSW